MLPRQPKMGDLLHARKQWYWYLENEEPHTELARSGLPGQSIYVRRVRLYSSMEDMPMDRGLLVISFEGTTLRFLHDNMVYRVTAKCLEHIMNDFDLASGIEEAEG